MELILACALWVCAPQASASDRPPRLDVGDVWRKIRHKEPSDTDTSGGRDRMVALAPVIGSNPSTGMTFGAAGQVAFYAGDPADTRLSSGIVSATVSTKRQALLNVRFGAFGDRNHWFLEGDNRLHRTSEDTFGLGTSASSSSPLGVKYDFIRFHETAYLLVHRVFVGVGILYDSHTNVRPADETDPLWATSPYVSYSERHNFSLDSQQSAGVSANALVDTRDNPIEARRGWYAHADYRLSLAGVLGSDGAWQSAGFDVRHYVTFDRARRHTIAGWFFADLVTRGAPPYFDLPATVMDTYGRSARGYRQGRFRGERLMYGELEYRTSLTRNELVGLVVFANATTLTNLAEGESLFDSVAPAGGAGLRLLLNKRSRTNLCMDAAWGKQGSRGVYFGIQEVF